MMTWMLVVHCIAGCVTKDFYMGDHATETACVSAAESTTIMLHARYPNETYEYTCKLEGRRGPGKRRS